MAIFKTFSWRQKELKGDVPEVFVYDKLPAPLRVQIVHILSDVVGFDSIDYHRRDYCFTLIRDILRKEHACFELIRYAEGPRHEVVNYFLELDDVDQALDVVDLAFKVISTVDGNYNFNVNSQPRINPNEAVTELNDRFKQHGVGYRFESNQIIRVDSDFTHADIIRPVLQLLRSKKFSGANEEFLKAHEHYRHNRYSECLVDALKSMESVIKSICDAKGWSYQSTDSIKRLLDLVFDKGLLPNFMQSEFSAIRGVLEGAHRW